jgi:hypothetical protein
MLSNSYRTIAVLPPNAIAVPTVKQATDFSCGAAAALSILRYWKWDAYASVDEASLYAALDTTHARGTEPEPIVSTLRGQGKLEAEYRHGDVTLAQLLKAVDAREPPIVDLQAWRDDERPWRETWNAGHYVVLVGYDAERLYFMDPSVLTPAAYAYLETGELEERWHDLAGPDDVRLERMAVFVRGPGPRWTAPEGHDRSATRLG